MKTCCRCKENKEYSEFSKLKRTQDGFNFRCRKCQSELDTQYRERRKEYARLNPNKEYQANWYSQMRKENPAKLLWKLAKKRAKDNNIIFDLEIEDIIVPDVCPVLGIPISLDLNGLVKYRASENSPSLDRTDSKKGYIKDNICVMSYKANVIKNYGTLEDHRKIVEYLTKLGE